jgi:D-3-phosphoglycerate dehydrogenase
VGQATSVDDCLRRSDVVTLHVPYAPSTKGLVNADRIRLMVDGATLLNFSRAGVVDEDALLDALDRGKVRGYVCDFPTPRLLRHERVIALPHIGASTHEAEENCAIMVADQIRAYLEDGNVHNSVNFPETEMPRNSGHRLAVVNRNVPNMLGQISTAIAEAELNIADMLNKSRGGLAYTLLDVDQPCDAPVLARLAAIDGVLSVRAL